MATALSLRRLEPEASTSPRVRDPNPRWSHPDPLSLGSILTHWGNLGSQSPSTLHAIRTCRHAAGGSPVTPACSWCPASAMTSRSHSCFSYVRELHPFSHCAYLRGLMSLGRQPHSQSPSMRVKDSQEHTLVSGRVAVILVPEHSAEWVSLQVKGKMLRHSQTLAAPLRLGTLVRGWGLITWRTSHALPFICTSGGGSGLLRVYLRSGHFHVHGHPASQSRGESWLHQRPRAPVGFCFLLWFVVSFQEKEADTCFVILKKQVEFLLWHSGNKSD